MSKKRDNATAPPGTRFSLAAKMALGASIFGTLTALGVAALMYMASSTAVDEMEALSTSEALERASVRLGASLDRLKQDTTILSTMPPIQGLIRTRESGGIDPLDGSTEVLWGERLAHIFTSFLEARSEYFQIRFVSASSDGLEIVRVEKTDDGIRRTPENELQSKAKRPYFERTLELKPGERFLSAFNLNREYGTLEVPHRPTVRATTPVFDEKTGEIFGMIVINANAQEYFSRMAAVLQSGQTLVVANAAGDYLYHPMRRSPLASTLANVILSKRHSRVSTTSMPTRRRSSSAPTVSPSSTRSASPSTATVRIAFSHSALLPQTRGLAGRLAQIPSG
ncbi:hypothetical protein [Methyloceanibacter sp. wino2]|uniref:hypothetical protein n=1 Tax=Methyloceanibacter sp. wino2 TaxID=2170729 RepID=UPI000D3E9814|nr:hypothetical protein [Methyloceanibacter sp. wino2]